MQTEVRLGPMGPDQPIVMVDDDELDREAAERGLKKSPITNPFMAFEDGSQFLDYLESVIAGDAPFPAVVLLDINMPLMPGFDVLKQMRALPDFEEKPMVMMLTSSTHDNDRKLSLQFGANDYLIKPHDYRDYSGFFEQLFA
ncbi:MAG: response regulator [Woeseia sp.]